MESPVLPEPSRIAEFGFPQERSNMTVRPQVQQASKAQEIELK